MLFERLTITENLFLGNERKTKAGFFDWKKMEEEATNMLAMFHIDASPQKQVRFLSLAEKALLQFARALLRNPQVVVLDELTDSLTYAETAIVYEILKQMRNERACHYYRYTPDQRSDRKIDRISILRDGQGARLWTRKTSTLIYCQTIMGSFESTYYPRTPVSFSQRVCSRSHISTHFLKRHQLFTQQGEALGIVGLWVPDAPSLMRAIVVLTVLNPAITVY